MGGENSPVEWVTALRAQPTGYAETSCNFTLQPTW
jgi:hypothetical protein